MLGPAEVALTTWAGSKLFEMFGNDTSRSAECRARVAGYFDEVGHCLERMAAKLRTNTIPRVEGHRLSALTEAFELIVGTNFYGSHELKDSEGRVLLAKLEESALAAKQADYFISPVGQVMTAPLPVEQLIEVIERAAGRFQGLAGMMRAVGPFKASSPQGKKAKT